MWTGFSVQGPHRVQRTYLWIFLLWGCSLLFLPSSLQARTFTWVNNGMGNWTDSTNWNPTGVPTGNDTAVIGVNGAVVVVNEGVTVSYIQVSGSVVLQISYPYSLWSTNGGTIGNNAQVQLTGSTSGSVVLQGGYGHRLIIQGDVTIQGNATLRRVELHGTTQVNSGRFGTYDVLNYGTLTWNTPYWHTNTNLGGGFSNYGTVYARGDTIFIAFQDDFTNYGTVVKDGGSDTTLLYRDNFRNEPGATLRATSGVLRTHGGVFSGTIEAQSNGTVLFRGFGSYSDVNFQGATFRGDGEIRVEESVISDFTSTPSTIDAGTQVHWRAITGLTGLSTDLQINGTLVVEKGRFHGGGNLVVNGTLLLATGDDSTQITLSSDIEVKSSGQMIWESGILTGTDGGDTIWVRSGGSLLLGATALASRWEGGGSTYGVIINESSTTVEKPNLATAVTLEIPVINRAPGVVHVKGGTLNLAASAGSYGGIWRVDSGAVLRFRGNRPDDRFWGEFQGQGTVRTYQYGFVFDSLTTHIRAGILFQESSAVYIRSRLVVDSGALYQKASSWTTYLYGHFDIQGLLQWDRGDVGGNNDSLFFQVFPGGQVVLEDTFRRKLYVPLANEGEIRVVDASWGLSRMPGNASTIINRVNGTIKLSGNAVVNERTYASTPFVENHGEIIRENDSGTAVLAVHLWNTGNVRSFGDLRLTARGRHEGRYEVQSGGQIGFYALSDTLYGAIFEGDSTGSFLFAGSAFLKNPPGDTAATVLGNAPLIYDGQSLRPIDGGILAARTGATLEFRDIDLWHYSGDTGGVVVDSGALLVFTGPDRKNIYGAKIWNKGEIRYEEGELYLGSGGGIQNEGVFRVHVPATAVQAVLRIDGSSSGSIQNRGEWILEGGGRLSVLSIRVKNEPDGTIWAQDGTLNLVGDRMHLSGELKATSGVLILSGFSSNDTLAGATITGPPSDSTDGVALQGPWAIQDSAVVADSGLLVMAGGSFEGDTLVVRDGLVDWKDGTFSGPVVVRPMGRIEAHRRSSGSRTLEADMIVQGTLLWAGPPEIDVWAPSDTDTVRLVIDTSGTFSIQDTGTVLNRLLSIELLRVHTGGRIQVSVPTALNAGTDLPDVWIRTRVKAHSGDIQVDGADLIFPSGYGHDHSWVVSGGSGWVVFGGPSSSSDTLKDTLYTLTMYDSARVRIERDLYLVWFASVEGNRAQLVLDASHYSYGIHGIGGGTGIPPYIEVKNGGEFRWINGTVTDSVRIKNTGGTVVLLPDLQASLGNGSEIRNSDSLYFKGDNFQMAVGTRIVNDSGGVWVVETDSGPTQITGMDTVPPPTLENRGTLYVNAPQNFGVFDVRLIHEGVTHLQQGRWSLALLQNLPDSLPHALGGQFLFHQGKLVFGWGGKLVTHGFQDLVFRRASGTRAQASEDTADVELHGFGTDPRFILLGENVIVDTGISFRTLGTNWFFLAGELRISGRFIWAEKSLKGSGDHIRVLPGGRLEASRSTTTPDTLGSNLLNKGTMIWDSSLTVVLQQATITNDSGGFWLIHDRHIGGGLLAVGDAQVVNAGTLQVLSTRTSPTGFITFAPSLTQRGLLKIQDSTGAGGVDFTTITQEGGTTVIQGQNTRIEVDTFRLYGGFLKGNGTIQTPSNGRILVNAGTISPGLSIDNLSLENLEWQTNQGRLEIEIGGENFYDQLNLNGNNTLGGVLEVTLTGGYTPSGGEQFSILKYMSGAQVNGDFVQKNFPPLPNGKQFRTEIRDTAYILKVVSPPVAVLDTFTIDEDQSFTLFPLLNDYDPDSDSVFISGLITDGTEGTPVLNPNGTVTYTPAPDSFGLDTFRYILSDTTGLQDTGLVRITIRPVNDTPFVSFAPIGWTVQFQEDQSAQIDLDDYVTDPDNSPDELTWTWNFGQLTLQKPKTQKSHILADTEGRKTGKNTQKFSLTSPVYQEEQRGTPRISPKEPSGPSRSNPVHEGTHLLNPPLYITIDPTTHVATFSADPDYFDTSGIFVTFTATDPEGASDSDGITVFIEPVPDPPVAMDDQATTDEDTPVTIPILANDYDVDGDPITLVGVNTNGTQGDVQVNPDQTVTYTPPPDFHGQDQFSYTITDGQLTDDALVIINVLPVNDPPVAQDDSVTTDEDTPVTIPVLANDTDADNDPLTVIGLILTGTLGSAVIDPGGQTVTYTPAPDSTRPDHFGYIVSDGQASDTGWVTVTINPINDPPVVSGMPDIVFKEDSSATLALDPYVNDPDNTPDEMTWTVEVLGMSVRVEPARFLPSFGKLPKPSPRILPRLFHLLQDSLTVVIDPVTRVATFWGTPNWYADSIPVVFTATDPEGASDSDTLLVTILPVNDPPTNFVRLWPEDGDTILGDSMIRLIWSSSKDTVEWDSVWYLLRVVIEGSWRDTLVDTTVTVGDTLVEWAMDSVMLTGIWRIGWDVWATDSIDTLEAENGHGLFYWAVTGVEERTQDPPRVRIIGGYPNPFVHEVMYVITGDGPKRIQVDVYDVVGRHVWTWDGEAEGRTVVGWDGRTLRGHKVRKGVYIVRMRVWQDAKLMAERTDFLIKVK